METKVKGGNEIMELYTFIMEYLGGTYISQIKANDGSVTMRKWIRKLNVSGIKGFSISDKQKIITDDFEDEEPILIKGTINAWIFLNTTKKGIGYINFVMTKKG